MKFAVFIDDKKQILPFYSSGIIEIYSDDESDWRCIKQIPFDFTIQKNLLDIQVKVKSLISKLEDSILLIVENMKGVPLSILQENGIGVWKASGEFFVDMFDLVQMKLTAALKAQEKKVLSPKLIGDKADAAYGIDLIALLQDDRSLNSIDILVPFIKETNFKNLQIRCSHLPKWMRQAVEEFQLTYQLEELETDVLNVTLKPAQWQKDISFRKYVRIQGAGGGCSCGG